MRFLIADLKRGLTEGSFYYSMLIGILCLLVSLFISIYNGKASDTSLFILSQSMILPFIAPLLAAIPYSNMNMLERETKYDSFMLIRLNVKGWEYKRLFTNGIVSGLAVSIPLLIVFCICIAIGDTSQLLYKLQVIFLDFLFGFVFGSLSYGLTFVNQKKYIPVIAPQVIYLLLIYAFPYLKLEKYYPPLCFSPWIMPSLADKVNIMLLLLLLFAIAIFLVTIGKLSRKLSLTSIGGRK